ncbi:MAG: LLM class flavin-dependent oxidoreductase, partial [Terriglobia bacterium]
PPALPVNPLRGFCGAESPAGMLVRNPGKEKSVASFGLTLANRGVIIGALKASDLLQFAQQGEASGAFDTVWIGDSMLAKPRLEAVTLLSALAAATSKVRLAVGCMATFVHRHPVMFAHQWASLDVLSNGRSLLAVCLGGPNEQSAAQALEHAVMGIQANERVARLEEGIIILRKLFHEEKASHRGRFYQFEGVTIQPHPIQQPCPIWIASNPTGLTWKDGGSASAAAIERSLRRVARFADGWMTNKVTPQQFRQQWSRIQTMAREEGRDPATLESALYHNLNVNEDRSAALAESKAFLDKYYTSNFSPKFVEGFTTAGSPQQCIQEFKNYFAAGLDHITLRMTSWNQAGQLKRFIEEVAPAF